MDRSAKEIFARLGAEGLERALGDLLDLNQLVRLSNAVGIKYRGMRTQSQKRERLVSDLVAKAARQETARKLILRLLSKETEQASREWTELPAEDKAQRLCDEDFLRTNGNLGLHLYLLATHPEATDLDGLGHRFASRYLVRIATNGNGPATEPAKNSREENRLRKKANELEKKARHLDAQLSKSREAHKTLKRDLIQRKGELAEARMLAERLRRDVNDAKAAAAAAGKAPDAPSEKTLADLAKTVRGLASEQKKVAHRLDKLPATPSTEAKTGRMDEFAGLVASLQKELGEDRKRRNREADEHHKKLVAELRTEIRKESRSPAPASRPSKKTRPKGTPVRVGVFIDVQNMYYSARQLKGKLDFDALLQAAVLDRRLIQATAYVVESKETDQSQFIAMLQQRAIEVRRKPLNVRADGSMKGDWDMELALDILDAAPKLDVVVLVSGDGDFTSLVKKVKRMGPRVEVIAFPRNTAKALVGAADRFQPLDRKFMIYSKAKTSDSAKAPPRSKAAAPSPRQARATEPKASETKAAEPKASKAS